MARRRTASAGDGVSDIDFHFPWYATPLFILLNLPYGLGLAVIALLVAGIPTFIIVALLARPLIDALRRRAAQQTAYEDAPQTHQSKTGTPTMGGLLFAIVPLAALLLHPRRDTLALAVLMFACMAIGAWDDVMSIRRQNNRGLRALPKLGLTALAAVAFFVVLDPQPLTIFPFGTVPAWLWTGLSLCTVLATTHAVNLTDGLDGLAAGAVIPPLFVLICACHYSSATIGVPFFGAAMIGAAGAFLIFNRHPARVFMGDTGSLALGAALSGIAIVTGMQLLLLVVGGVFVAEALSVIIQVISYKTTRRRVFRMSPLHHHFELAGWPEAAVTARFWLGSLVVSALGFALLVSLVHARID
jgi:phospho-N-acetylmuramoyl-pentapeptide-transferase